MVGSVSGREAFILLLPMHTRFLFHLPLPFLFIKAGVHSFALARGPVTRPLQVTDAEAAPAGHCLPFHRHLILHLFTSLGCPPGLGTLTGNRGSYGAPQTSARAASRSGVAHEPVSAETLTIPFISLGLL